MLEIKNLRKNFDNGTQALKGVSFKVKRGEFISILGPSGSGKTTLLRSINGLESIENGEVIFDNKKITKKNLPDVQRKTGMIFQEFNLVNNLSSINNVLTGLLNSSSKFLSMFYIFTKEQKLEALQSLKTVGLLQKSYSRVDELSGGQRQRIGIARALYFDSDLLVLDEATSSLDENTEKNIINSINQMKGKKTILISAHKKKILKDCDVIFKVENGNIIQYKNLESLEKNEKIN